MTKKQMRQLLKAARGAANAHNEGDKTAIHNLKGCRCLWQHTVHT